MEQNLLHTVIEFLNNPIIFTPISGIIVVYFAYTLNQWHKRKKICWSIQTEYKLDLPRIIARVFNSNSKDLYDKSMGSNPDLSIIQIKIDNCSRKLIRNIHLLLSFGEGATLYDHLIFDITKPLTTENINVENKVDSSVLILDRFYNRTSFTIEFLVGEYQKGTIDLHVENEEKEDNVQLKRKMNSKIVSQRGFSILGMFGQDIYEIRPDPTAYNMSQLADSIMRLNDTIEKASYKFNFGAGVNFNKDD